MKKLKRLIKWIKVLRNLDSGALGLYTVMYVQLCDMQEDLEGKLSEFDSDRLRMTIERMKEVITNKNQFEMSTKTLSALASATEAIRKYSNHWK